MNQSDRPYPEAPGMGEGICHRAEGRNGCIRQRALQVPAHSGPVQLQLSSDATARPAVSSQR
jgi:hypothetical protein